MRAITGIDALIRAFLSQAEAGADWVMPGFTHLQTAQPVLAPVKAWFDANIPADRRGDPLEIGA